jgi:hypothetical protein
MTMTTPQNPSSTGKVDLQPTVTAKNKSYKAIEFPDGVSVSVTGPVTYTMYYPIYPISPHTFTESFVYVVLDSSYVSAADDAIDGAVDAVAAWLSTLPTIGDAAAGFLELAARYYTSDSQNPDGSVTVMLAQHYVGTKAGGMDITAVPLPGVNADSWAAVLNGVRALAG